MDNKDNINLDNDNVIDNNIDDNFNKIICSRCGLENSNENNFCLRCGNKLIKDGSSFKDTIYNNSRFKNFTSINQDERFSSDWDNLDMISFIQKKTEYYIPKFKEMQEFNKSASWNWSAFFFNELWFLYRKMYGIGFGLMALSFILSYIPIIGGFLPFAIYILSGFYGNMLYLKHVEKNLTNANNMHEDIKNRFLLSSGGVNIILPLVLVLLLVILVAILVLIFGIAFSSQFFFDPFVDSYFYY